MSFSFGEKFKITIFGQSHSEMMGVVIDGIPAGIKLDTEKIEKFTSRRSPKKGNGSTERKETDRAEIVSGLVEGITCGAPLCALIKNEDCRSVDYERIKNLPRPSHADFTAYMKYNGFNDIRGGGSFSGRMTAPLCFAGAVALQLLNAKGIFIGAHIENVADVCDEKFNDLSISEKTFENITEKSFPVISDEAGERMLKKIDETKGRNDSVGGKIQCAVTGLPAGVGEPLFDSLESVISHAVFSVPAVKGIEFGSTKDFGSENNDPFVVRDGKIVTETNNHGGILGGISSGMPVLFSVTVKPTPSIGMPQKTVELDTLREKEVEIGGRHDACILPRAVPCVEAATALAVINLL